MSAEAEPAVFELVTFTGVFEDTDGTQIAVATEYGVVEADVDQPPEHLRPGDAVALHAVRMNSEGWFKTVAIVQLAIDS